MKNRITRKEELSGKFPQGSRIRLLEKIRDPQPIEKGAEGTVRGIDDMGNILMRWDDGRSLSLLPDVDVFEVLK